MRSTFLDPAPPPPYPGQPAKPIAHRLHTVALFALLLLSTFYTHHHASAGAIRDTPRIPRYLGSIVLEWILLGLVLAGIHHRRDFLRTAFLNRARTALESLGLGVITYILGFMAILFTGSLLYFTPLFHQRNEAVILALAPHTPLEFVLWFCVSLTAGITEELIFRGYLLEQLTAWTRSSVAAIFIAALLFGCVHLYEGFAAILPLAALAIVYGFVVRHLKGDLRAVIVAHTLQDFMVALIVLARPTLERYAAQPH